MMRQFHNVTIGETGERDPIIAIKGGKFTDTADNHSEIEHLTFNEPCYLLPGFIDVHIHGIANADVMDGTEEALDTMQRALVKEGTTSFLPTTLTGDFGNLLHIGGLIQNKMGQHESGATILGAHVEGPFIHPNKRGAQPLEHILKMNKNHIDDLLAAYGDALRIITLAPELDHDEQIKRLANEGVTVSIGHTEATYEETSASIVAGASHITHLYNAMTGFHHREVGVVGAAFLRPELTVELIADGYHASKEAVQLCFQTIGADRLLLITDSMRAKGMGDGAFDLGGQEVTVLGSEARLSNDVLAGSVLKMNEAAALMREVTSCSLAELVKMTSTNQAKKLGIGDRKGSIALGFDADFIIVNERFDIMQTYVNGKLVFDKKENAE
ncbi:N-acetylglucosamine-6-phosphate deacetylase [Paenalkalicoccus suaedae]|uniref:N-acetylglucosamine-6-phosphate deacetylase n=1 Tax=Paenalkalicoccus suaedae TaxID=2592382 RepID=A0A859FBF7_9BACI|nr:N-acetylglucosamine-6-phosphate deacetylase [Paenalkalicoccus suaedae]QKS70158.1 N-acetylglucosamine-6-phosphate deacetylase [Paenalkalicoccus suaedae]